MTKIKLIIFDFDGVLVISNRVHIDVTRRALRHVGIEREISDKEITYHFGKAYKDVLKAIMDKDYTEERLERAARYQYNLLLSGWFMDRMQPIKGLKEFLMKLKRRGIRIVTGTGNDKKFMNKALKFLKLDNVFDLILTIEDVKESKPSPEIVEKAMKHFGVRKNETLFVGDARNDVLSAKNAGVKSAVVLTGVLNREEAGKLNPDYILENVLEIERIID